MICNARIDYRLPSYRMRLRRTDRDHQWFLHGRRRERAVVLRSLEC
jgi:hypothetical protein